MCVCVCVCECVCERECVIFLALFKVTWLEADEFCVFERFGKTETKEIQISVPCHIAIAQTVN